MYVIAKEQLLRQHNLKEQKCTIAIVAIVFAITALSTILAANHQSFRSASTTLMSAPDSPIPMTPSGSQAGRKQTNPFRGFRNVGSPQ